MCELFGLCSSEKINCTPLLKLFFANAVNHPDGWGLSRFADNVAFIEKEPISAADSQYLLNRMTDEISEKILLAHIRKASVGVLSYRNSHPFSLPDITGRLWTLIHNGTVFDNHILDHYREQQKGQTDSERILYCLVDRINLASASEGGPLPSDRRFAIADQMIRDIAPQNKINLILYDNEYVYVHSNDPGTLHRCRFNTGYIFSTRCLDDNENWEEVALNTLVSYKNGEQNQIGSPHGNTFDRKLLEQIDFSWNI